MVEMKNEDILDLVRRCNLEEEEELIPGKAYLINRKFRMKVGNKTCYDWVEMIVLVKNGVKVGGLYRMGSYDIHIVIDERFQGQHIMSGFAKTGIVQEIWPENESVELCGVYTRNEFQKKKYLASLFGLRVRNEEQIEEHLRIFRQ